MNKVLIITYYWPPSGGAGVQRWLKFSKYLPEFGWEPYILTVDPDYAAYPVTDNSRNNDLSDKIKVFRTTAINYFSVYSKNKIPSAGFANNVDDSFKGKMMRFIRGNFFIPDPRRGWNKFAFRKACSLIEKENISTVISTSPPHSTQLTGLKLKKRFPEIKWIADLRDPWTDIYYYEQFYPTFLPGKLDRLYERNVLKKADLILTVGESLKERFSKKQAGIADKIDVITNGFDETDFAGREKTTPSRFTITYVGTISDKYPLNGLLKALKELKEDNHDFILRLVGTVPEKILEEVRKNISAGNVEHITYTPHEKAIGYMMDSSMLLLIIPDHASNRSIITGKIFEYIATGNPVLCLGPTDGDAASIINAGKFGNALDYNDTNNIVSYIRSLMSGTATIKSDAIEFSHKNITKKLAISLEKTTANKRVSSNANNEL